MERGLISELIYYGCHRVVLGGFKGDLYCRNGEQALSTIVVEIHFKLWDLYNESDCQVGETLAMVLV